MCDHVNSFVKQKRVFGISWGIVHVGAGLVPAQSRATTRIRPYKVSTPRIPKEPQKNTAVIPMTAVSTPYSSYFDALSTNPLRRMSLLWLADVISP